MIQSNKYDFLKSEKNEYDLDEDEVEMQEGD